MRSTNGIFVVKNLIFFQSPIKKVGFITLILGKLMLICGQFIKKDLTLLSRLLFEHFEKLNFSDF